MSQLLPPWSLHWSSNGELCPLDREDLFLCLHLPRIPPFHQGLGNTGATGNGTANKLVNDDLPFPYR